MGEREREGGGERAGKSKRQKKWEGEGRGKDLENRINNVEENIPDMTKKNIEEWERRKEQRKRKETAD